MLAAFRAEALTNDSAENESACRREANRSERGQAIEARGAAKVQWEISKKRQRLLVPFRLNQDAFAGGLQQSCKRGYAMLGKTGTPTQLCRLLGLIGILLSPVLARAEPFELFAVSDLANIFEDGYQCPPPKEAIDVFGIRNEYVSGQCVIEAREDLQEVTVSVSPLTLVGETAHLSKDTITWNFVGSVPLNKNNPHRRESDVLRPAPALFPDYLAEERSLALPAGKYQAVFLTIKIPRDAAAGVYTGTVRVETDKGKKQLPLRLTVYPLMLPDERHLMVTEWYSTRMFSKFHGIDTPYSELFFDMLRVYAENMVEHRQNVFRVDMKSAIVTTQDKTGKLNFDFSRFDRWAEIFWNTGRMDLLETGFLATYGPKRWSSTDIFLQDFAVKKEGTDETVTLPGNEVIPVLMPAFENHLREKGWLDKTVFHIQDESSAHNVMRWREVSDYFHQYAPSLRRIDAIEATHFFDNLEVWVPKLNHLDAWYEIYQKARKQGCELWFYTVGVHMPGSYPNKGIDLPLIENRLLHWLNYRFGLSGFLHWGFNQWRTDDPYTEVDRHLGDGWHVYPKKDGLLNSIRWEQMRNGIQDYEYLWLLEDKIRSMTEPLGERFAMIEPSRRGKEIAAQVVKTATNYIRDPDVLYAVKKQVIEEILDLEKSPRMIVQTNPPEHSTVIKGGSVEVFGWVEPETTITVNGTELPVSPDGLFMEKLTTGSRDAYEIAVTAKSEKGTKTIVRSFQTVYRKEY